MMWLLLGLMFVSGVVSYITGYVVGSDSQRFSTPPRPKKNLKSLGIMRISEVDALAIPTTELFVAKSRFGGGASYAREEDRVPDTVWMTWPKSRDVRVWWYTDTIIP